MKKSKVKYSLLTAIGLTLVLGLYNNCSESGVLKGESSFSSIEFTNPVQIVSNYTEGTFEGLTFNPANDYLFVNTQTPENFGSYTSPVYDAGAITQWERVSWIPRSPIGKDLPDGQQIEATYSFGIAPMSSNVALYHMDALESGNGLVDTSGGSSLDNSGVCPAISCPTVVGEGAFLNALEFTGNEEIEIAHTDDLVIPRGVAALWIKLVQAPTERMTIFSKDGLGQGDGGHLLFEVNAEGRLSLTYGTAVEDIVIVTNRIVPIGEWTHVAVTWGNGLRIIQDGVQAGANNAIAGGIGTNTEALFLGRQNPLAADPADPTPPGPFVGQMDEFAIFNQQLPANAIRQIYQRAAGQVLIQARTCATPDCSEDPQFSDYVSEEDNLSNTIPDLDITGLLPNNRYLQFRIEMTAFRANGNPFIRDVSFYGRN